MITARSLSISLDRVTSRSCGRSFSSRLRTIDQYRSGSLNGLVPLCLRHIGRSCTSMNTHVNGGGSVQLGSIRNPDPGRSDDDSDLMRSPLRRAQRDWRIPDRAPDVRPTNHDVRAGTLPMWLRSLHHLCAIGNGSARVPLKSAPLRWADHSLQRANLALPL